MTDQEEINKYLINNPLKRSVSSKDKYLTPPCIACGKPVTAKNKKPITSPQGEMNSTVGVKMEGFPEYEQEDLCNTCKISIRYYSINLDAEEAISFEEDRIGHDGIERQVEYFTDNLDADYLETELEYQGYSDFETMEGTSFKIKDYD